MNTQGGSSGGQDYADKGLAAVEKKFGGSYGQKAAGNKNLNEKVTDKARDMFEKTTGKNVPDKVSN